MNYLAGMYVSSREIISSSVYIFRCLDEAFMTWNGDSPYELFHLLENMAKNQDPLLTVRFSINNQVTYFEAELGHINGKIDNKMNHTSIDYPFSFLPHRHDSIQKKISLVETFLHRAVQCCSNVFNYRCELDSMQSIYYYYGIPFQSIMKQISHSPYEYLDYDSSNFRTTDQYDMYRRLIQAREDQRMNEQQETLHIYCPLKGQQLMELNQKFQYLFTQWCKTKTLDTQKFNMKIVHRPNYPANTK